MIDLQVYEIPQETPHQNRYDEHLISWKEALYLVWKHSEELEKFFQNLSSIRLDTRYTLPSGNAFLIQEQWILFKRKGKTELRHIHADNHHNASITINTLHYHPQGRELCITGKKMFFCKKEKWQILWRDEIVGIFSSLEQGIPYKSPATHMNGQPRKTILQIKKS